MSLAPGTWVWGHDTATTETFEGDLADGTGTGTVSGSADDEIVSMSSGQTWISPAVNTGSQQVTITYDQYQTGEGVAGTIEYRTGANKTACLGAGWLDYTVPFSSSGWVQVRLTA